MSIPACQVGRDVQMDGSSGKNWKSEKPLVHSVSSVPLQVQNFSGAKNYAVFISVMLKRLLTCHC